MNASNKSVKKSNKVYRTYSLNIKTDKLLNKIYIKHLTEDIKIEKSEIVCEGIQLVYKKEFNK